MIGDRIRDVRKHFNLTQNDFAEMISVTRDTIANYELGRVEPPKIVIKMICSEFEIYEKWLRDGEGNMFETVSDRIGERIREIRKANNMSQTEFASVLGSAQNTITGYEVGRRNPSNQMIALICREFGVSEQWLRTGEGEMLGEFEVENSIGGRIRSVRNCLKLTQQQFADRIGIKRNTVATYETGRSEPVGAVVSLICREFSVSEKWLRTGEGSMYERETCKEIMLTKMFSEILREKGLSSFKMQVISSLLELRDEEWNMLYSIFRRIENEIEINKKSPG